MSRCYLPPLSTIYDPDRARVIDHIVAEPDEEWPVMKPGFFDTDLGVCRWIRFNLEVLTHSCYFTVNGVEYYPDKTIELNTDGFGHTLVLYLWNYHPDWERIPVAVLDREILDSRLRSKKSRMTDDLPPKQEIKESRERGIREKLDSTRAVIDVEIYSTEEMVAVLNGLLDAVNSRVSTLVYSGDPRYLANWRGPQVKELEVDSLTQEVLDFAQKARLDSLKLVLSYSDSIVHHRKRGDLEGKTKLRGGKYIRHVLPKPSKKLSLRRLSCHMSHLFNILSHIKVEDLEELTIIDPLRSFFEIESLRPTLKKLTLMGKDRLLSFPYGNIGRLVDFEKLEYLGFHKYDTELIIEFTQMAHKLRSLTTLSVDYMNDFIVNMNKGSIYRMEVWRMAYDEVSIDDPTRPGAELTFAQYRDPSFPRGIDELVLDSTARGTDCYSNQAERMEPRTGRVIYDRQRLVDVMPYCGSWMPQLVSELLLKAQTRVKGAHTMV